MYCLHLSITALDSRLLLKETIPGMKQALWTRVISVEEAKKCALDSRAHEWKKLSMNEFLRYPALDYRVEKQKTMSGSSLADSCSCRPQLLGPADDAEPRLHFWLNVSNAGCWLGSI